MNSNNETKSPLWKYLLIMIIPLAVLLSRPAIPLTVLAFGQEVKLLTVPFDPRDVFRGDYVELRFAIEDIDSDIISPNLLSKLNENREKRINETEVYVSLKPDDAGISKAVLVSDTPPANDIYIRGKINRRANRINYGNNLSRYYVRENTGLELEEAARKGQIHASAKVLKGYIVLDAIEKTDMELREK